MIIVMMMMMVVVVMLQIADTVRNNCAGACVRVVRVRVAARDSLYFYFY